MNNFEETNSIESIRVSQSAVAFFAAILGTRITTPYSVCWLTFSNTPTLASITNKLDPP